MSLFGNILWMIFGGLLSALGYWIAGLLLCCTIIGIPFGIQALRMGLAILTPFGKRIEKDPDHQGFLALVFDVIWLVFFGWEVALAHIASALVCAITIIGIPFAVQHLKLVPVALMPFMMHLED